MKNLTAVTLRRAAMAWTLGMSTLLTVQTADAQPRWGRPASPRAGACFYRDFDFRGDYFCARAGEEVPVLGRGMNDQISSIRIFGDAQVRIFQNTRFGGRSNRIDGDVYNLRREGWNDQLSSFIVRNDRDRRDQGDWGRGPGMGRRNDDRNGGGYGRGNDRGNDRGNGRGNDGRGNNGRGQLTQQEAEQIVAAAYRGVLNREPDPASRPWVDRVLRERLTQAQVEAELRKSDEYKNKRR